MRFILSALAAVALLVGVAATQPAEAQARCFWDGFALQCFHRPHYGYWLHPYWGHPYWGDPYWDRPAHGSSE